MLHDGLLDCWISQLSNSKIVVNPDFLCFTPRHEAGFSLAATRAPQRARQRTMKMRRSKDTARRISGGRMRSKLRVRQVQKLKIYKEIVDQIKTSILREQIREGDRLPTERELADQFRVSRVSVRQALTVLAEMGLVESWPGGGTFVRNGIKEGMQSPLSELLFKERELLQEPLEVRRIIEPEITRLAAVRATTQDIEELERIINKQEQKAKQRVPITEEDTLFHESIAKMTKNCILVKLVQSLHQHLRASREQSLTAPSGNQRSIEDHRKILAAITAKNPKAAHQAMMRHLQNVEALISHALKATS
jgi:GntR family transcriptional repressor for pyruvate dehydrogenase complex